MDADEPAHLAECPFPSILVVLMETGVSLQEALAHPKAGISQTSYYTQVLSFLNLKTMVDPQAALAAHSVTTSGSRVLYESWNTDDDGSMGEASSIIHNAILREAKQEEGRPGPAALSAALSKALCYINRLRQGTETPARILCILASPDPSAQYIPLMNTIFAAQRGSIKLDCCNIGLGEARFAQQASQLTDGIYLQPSEPGGLIQYLLMVFGAGPKARGMLRMSPSSGDHGGATCMCHRKPLTIGFICSVCLSVLCEPQPVCLTCGSTFDPS